MGYRSNVTIKVTQKHKYQLLKVLHEVEFPPESIEEDEDYFSVTLYDYKWYDGYEDVDKVTTFINSLEDEGGIQCIGEDSDTWAYGEPWNVGLYTTVLVDSDMGESTYDPNAPEFKDFQAFMKQYPEKFI